MKHSSFPLQKGEERERERERQRERQKEENFL